MFNNTGFHLLIEIIGTLMSPCSQVVVSWEFVSAFYVNIFINNLKKMRHVIILSSEIVEKPFFRILEGQCKMLIMLLNWKFTQSKEGSKNIFYHKFS